MSVFRLLPKATLFVRWADMLTPELIERFADRNGLSIPKQLFLPNGRFIRPDTHGYVKNIYRAQQLLRTMQDYQDTLYDYCKRAAAESVVYCEIVLPAARTIPVSLQTLLSVLNETITIAERRFGTVCRLIVSRDARADMRTTTDTIQVAQEAACVLGFVLHSEEGARNTDRASLTQYYRTVHDAGLACILSVDSHISSVIDTSMFHRIATVPSGYAFGQYDGTLVWPAETVVPEMTQAFRSGTVPFPDAAYTSVLPTIGVGAPDTTLADVYRTAQDMFGWDDDSLVACTRRVIDAAYIDARLQQQLHARIDTLFARYLHQNSFSG